MSMYIYIYIYKNHRCTHSATYKCLCTSIYMYMYMCIYIFKRPSLDFVFWEGRSYSVFEGHVRIIYDLLFMPDLGGI